MTVKHRPDVIRSIEERFKEKADFILETDVGSLDSLHAADMMISDFSGVALEYAFGFERPVLFVDVERKVNNPDYDRIPHAPLEVSIRNEIGEVISPGELRRVPSAVRRLCSGAEGFAERIRQARQKNVYHVGRSGVIGAEELVRIADGTAAHETRPAEPVQAGV